MELIAAFEVTNMKKILVVVVLFLVVLYANAATMPEVLSGLPMREVLVGTNAVSLGSYFESPYPGSYPSKRVIVLSTAGGDVRVRFDGENPTSTNGHVVSNGSWLVWPSKNANAAKLIRSGTNDVTVSISEAAE